MTYEVEKARAESELALKANRSFAVATKRGRSARSSRYTDVLAVDPPRNGVLNPDNCKRWALFITT
jgi:hypothetical protein